VETTARAETHRSASGGKLALLVWPLGILAALTLLFRFTNLDIFIADFFFDEASWFWFRQTIVGRWSPELAPLLAALALLYIVVVLLGSVWIERLRAQRVVAGFMLVCLALGPGLIVNLVFKDNFGRPRPFDVERYGGSMPYMPLWEPSSTLPGYSFPSGDASVGFYCGLPAFVIWRRNRRLAWRFVALGLVLGSAIGLGRIAWGAHWVSDVVWSAGFIYITGLIVHWLFSLPWRRWVGPARA
jgi:membrane-associated PAP2 superfamily phosphatase